MTEIKRPEPFRIGELYANAERGPDRDDHTKWYWRVRERSTGQKVYIGWTTESHVREMMRAAMSINEEVPAVSVAEPAVVEPLPAEPKPVHRMLSVGIVSDTSHAKGLTVMLRNKGHVGYYMPHVSKVKATVDVLVCRHRSGSHAMFDVCMDIAREGKIPVIFENGATQALEQIDQILAGTWTQSFPRHMQERLTDRVSEDNLVSPEEASENERRARLESAKSAINQVLEKGGFFCNTMIAMKPESVRDVLGNIPHVIKDRVRRTSTFQTILSLQKVKHSHVEEASDDLAASGTVAVRSFWGSDGKTKWMENLLSWETCTDQQFVAFLSEMNRRGLSVMLSEHEPEITILEIPELTQSEPSPVEPLIDLVDENPSHGPAIEPPAPMKVVSSHDAAVPQDVIEILHLLQAEMDRFGVMRLPAAVLEKAGFTDTGGFSLTSITVHAKAHGDMASMCGTPSIRSSAIMSHVTCAKCMNLDMFKVAEAYQSMLLAEMAAAK